MNLAVDIGNSSIKMALFDDGQMAEMIQGDSDGGLRLKELLADNQVDHVIISSVADTAIMVEVPEVEGLFIELGHETRVPVGIEYSTPETLGNDRVAAAVGAGVEFPNRNVLIVDAGTCITYDLLSADHNFKGGNIAPGLDMRLKSMHHYTGRLPSVEKGEIVRLLGDSTYEAMMNGAVIGILMEIEGYRKELEQRYNDLIVVLTGGDGAYLSEMSKTEIFVRPNLVLSGLNEILNFNVAESN